jgi:activating signal cointegrator 1
VIQKSQKPATVFKEDQAFYREQDDVGMCLSMHQPWASLLVHGFKRFEGRAWNNKYRGALWIHATSKKPSQEEIDHLEEVYTDFYRPLIGDDMPQFPDRYLTGCVVGRVDLIDVISLQEYQDTIPR